MPNWIILLFKSLAFSRLKNWVIKNGAMFFFKFYVKKTSNTWDDKLLNALESILDDAPPEIINNNIKALLDCVQSGEKGE